MTSRIVWKKPFEIEYSLQGSVNLFDIREEIGRDSDITFLRFLVKARLERDLGEKCTRHFALRFTDNSSLTTRTISTLLHCLEIVSDAGRELGVVNPNGNIAEAIETFLRPVRIVSSVEELGT
ncbi:MAG: hypothetical protein GF418_11525 [Chitinivibrionales bacterium]|nr:hypothetical protein [Chitinivibrionales bacterium]MBD3396245.1 hypothetical protein [Chitinivibrionales bacterium]